MVGAGVYTGGRYARAESDVVAAGSGMLVLCAGAATQATSKSGSCNTRDAFERLCRHTIRTFPPNIMPRLKLMFPDAFHAVTYHLLLVPPRLQPEHRGLVGVHDFYIRKVRYPVDRRIERIICEGRQFVPHGSRKAVAQCRTSNTKQLYCFQRYFAQTYVNSDNSLM